MKKYFYLLFVSLSLISCKKVLLHQYGEELYGEWENTSINKVGVQGDYSGLDFRRGKFVFTEGGSLRYTDLAGKVYEGNWITDETKEADCYTGPDGDDICTNDWRKTLKLTASGASSQQKNIYFYEVIFVNKDQFKARVKTDYYTRYEYLFTR